MFAQFIVRRILQERAIFKTEKDGGISMFFDSSTMTERAVLIAEKQKAVEGRAFRKLLEDAYNELKVSYDECWHPDNLCMTCPRCYLFGASTVSTQKTNHQNWNIKTRIFYSDSFSDQPYSKCVQDETHIGINDKTASNGRSLQRKSVLIPLTTFLSIITLQNPSIEELAGIKHILSQKSRFGAMKGHLGLTKTEIIAAISSNSEKYSVFDFIGKNNVEIINQIKQDKITFLDIPPFKASMALVLKNRSEEHYYKIFNNQKTK